MVVVVDNLEPNMPVGLPEEKIDEEVQKEDDSKIMTSSDIKRNYQMLMALHYQDLGLPDSYEPIYIFIIGMMAIKGVREKVLKELEEIEKIGIKKEDILGALNNFKRLSAISQQISREIKSVGEKYKGGVAGTKELESALLSVVKQININIPITNYYLEMIKTIIVHNTDLFRIEIPRVEIKGLGFSEENRTKKIQDMGIGSNLQ